VTEACTWCAAPVADDDGFRASMPHHAAHATFCRLEHVVPWAMRGARWNAGASASQAGGDDVGLGGCTHCGAGLGDERVLLVRHRGKHRIGDAFCGVDHLGAWARRGGRFQAPR
jgi:hypothetical protein